MPIWDDPQALADAIRKARGTATQKVAGAPIGVSYKTWGRWEREELESLGDTPEKRFAVAVQVAAATGRHDLFGLSEPGPVEVDQLREEMRQIKVELLAEIEKVRRAQASPQASSEPSAGD
jgi:hypothetical protein